ncbi:MAG: response regulator [bacterium]
MKSPAPTPPEPSSTILLVDDDPTFLQDLRDLLLTYMPNTHVLTAQSGVEALAILRSKSVDLIISDQNMPEMDGLHFLDAARTHHPDVPRIMMTGYPVFETAMGALNQARVGEFIPKPPNPERTIQAVKRALIERSINRESGAAGSAA